MHQIVAFQVEDDLAGLDSANDIGIHVGYRVVGHLESEELPYRVSVVVAELLKIVGDPAINA